MVCKKLTSKSIMKCTLGFCRPADLCKLMVSLLFMKMKMKTPPIHLLQVYGFSKQDAEKAAELEIELENRGIKAKATVLIISSIVINKGASLCSLNENFYELKTVGL